MTEQGELFNVMSSPASADCWVYVIGVPGRSVAKIGIATDTSRRLANLQTSHPERLALLWRVPGSRELEIEFHKHFHGQRLMGEWFDFGGQDPADCVRAAYTAITRLPAPTEPVAPPVVVRSLEVTDAPIDKTRPAEDDPDRDDPLYEMYECGCRQLTPSECVLMGLPANSIVTMPVAQRKPGTLPCCGLH